MIRSLCLFARSFLGLSPLPVHVTFFVTGRCMLKCRTCFYAHHLNRAEPELSLDEITRLAPQLRGVLWLAVTGGEPFMRDDLGEVLAVLLKEARPPYVTLVTNGFRPEKVESVLSDIIPSLQGSVLRVSVSLDGAGEVHDRIRGVPGSFERACETIDVVRQLQSRFDRLQMMVCTCYNALNQDSIEDIPAFLEERHPGIPWDFVLVRGEPADAAAGEGVDVGRYFRLKRQHSTPASQERRSPMERLIAAKNSTMIGLQEDILLRERMRVPCRAGSMSAVIREQGDVIACEIAEYPMGNLRDLGLDMRELWRSDVARAARRDVGESGCICGHECNLASNMFYSTSALLSVASKLLR